MKKAFLLVILLMCFTSGRMVTVHAQGTAFTYQGRLSNGSAPVNGSYDLSFTLYSDSTTATVLAGPITNSSVVVTNGLFTTLVDFGPGVFVGGSNWLAIAVSPRGFNSFSVLNPRQQITPAPYSLNVVGTVKTSQLVGTIPASSITGLSSSAIAPQGMVLVPSGTFTMGNSLGDADIGSATPVATYVSAFYMDANLVSYGLWTNVYTYAIGHGYDFNNIGTAKDSSASQPVQTVNWYACVKWCNARSEHAGLMPVYYTDSGLTAVYRTGEPTSVYANWSAKGYRLPTEAEWEKAARGGLIGQRFPWGNTISTNQANYTATAGSPSYDLGPTGSVGSTTPAGSYPPNGYGLYDMAGNLWEWCWDWYAPTYAGGTDPHGPDTGSDRMFRGGSWADDANNGARCAYRYEYGNTPNRAYFNVGFRTVMTGVGATVASSTVSFTGNLAGDVTGTQSATVVATVGGSTAANVHSAEVAANAATSVNTPSTIVKRDASGNISAGAVTATSFSGNGSGLTNIPASAVVGLSSAAIAPTGMVLIPAGSFMMGANPDGGTSVMTTVSTSFYMDVNLVTLSQWQTVYNWATILGGYSFIHQGSGKASNHPVQSVDWYDCVKWCNARSEQAGLTPVYYTDSGFTSVCRTGEPTVYANWAAKGYRLPTEAEWERAARGGLSGQRFPWGNTISQKQANYYSETSIWSYDLGPNGSNALGIVGGTSPGTSPVGSFLPNGYGLYDMAGNVFHWCWDWFGPYSGGTDPMGPASGSNRVIRGGAWHDTPDHAQCANRDQVPPATVSNFGFRAVLSLGQ
jgi:formylglycine-generating enzyme